jgi:2-dehydropantoate 2-reductase
MENMESKKSRFAVIGAGAIGGAVAAFLARAGYDVTLACKNPETAKHISEAGIHIQGVKGEFVQKVPAAAAIEDLGGLFDYALICVKAYDLQNAAQRILPLLKPDSLAVSLQNGICVDTLADIVGRERAVGCVVGWGSTLHAPALIEITSTGEFVIGGLKDLRGGKPPELRGALDCVFPTEIVRDIYARLYSKLIVNSCITSLGAVSGLLLGPMLARKDCREIFIAIMREAMTVASVIGVSVPAYGGKLDYSAFLKGTGGMADLRRHAFLRLFGAKYSRLKSSSLQSLERGGRTEIEYFNGYIVRRAKEAAVAVPVNTRITAMVKEIEAGTRRISQKNLTEIRI